MTYVFFFSFAQIVNWFMSRCLKPENFQLLFQKNLNIVFRSISSARLHTKSTLYSYIFGRHFCPAKHVVRKQSLMQSSMETRSAHTSRLLAAVAVTLCEPLIELLIFSKKSSRGALLHKFEPVQNDVSSCVAVCTRRTTSV